MNLQKLEALKNKKNLSNKEISELTGISPPTIGRIFNGQGDPSFENVAAITRALGGSMDELAGLARDEGETVRELRALVAAQESQLAAYEKVINAYDGVISEKVKASEYLKKIIRYLAIALTVLGLVFVGIVIFDILNGGVGYVRYDELSQQDRMEVLLSVLPDWFGLR